MPQMLVLVGLPGCGKTSFSRRMVVHTKNWVIINQDEMGSRSHCEQSAAKHLKEGKNVVIDRSNFDEDQRKVWVKIGHDFGCPVDALFFDIDVKVCKERVKARKGHPTGVEGKFGAEVVARFDRLMTRPTTYEGFRFIHNISPHLPPPKKGACDEEIYREGVIASIMILFPPESKPSPCKDSKPAEPKPQPSQAKPGVTVNVKVENNTNNNNVTKANASGGADFFNVPWAGKPPITDMVKPNEGYGTYKETKAMWEDENHTQHFNHSLFNEQAEHDKSGGREFERKTRHLQHSDHMVNPTAGIARAFDHLSLDRDQQGHEVCGDGKKRHFHDRSHYYHQHEQQEDAKLGTARTYEHKHMNSFRHIHEGDPDRARTEAFEHRSFNYAFKGGVGFDPEQVMSCSSKNRLKFEDQIKASFHNLPLNERFSFAQNIKFETDVPKRPF